MVGLVSSIAITPNHLRPSRTAANRKADVVEHLEVFDHVGLLVNEPPGAAGLPFH
jgi:hypothetical protein